MAAVDRVGIEVEVLGYEGAIQKMKQLERAVKGLSGKNAKIKVADGRIMSISQRIKELRRNILGLQAEANRLNLDPKGNAERLSKVRQEIRESRAELNRLTAAAREASASLGQVFNRISSRVAHLGSAMQSAGNALTRLYSPFRGLTNGMLMGAGFGAFSKVSEGLKSGFSRYDTMKKYVRMMKSFEKGGYTAQKSIDALDASVQGLPTSLDEMVSLSQRFTMTVGDMRKGTQLAIATNNAFLSSMATDTQRYQGMMQLQDVIGGKKMTSKEWQSLANSMLPAIRMMGQDLGKTGKELDEWVASVQQGKVANKEFLDALLKTGTGSGRAAKMAMESKNTWEAFTARIGTAFSRMTYGILTSMDELVKSASGGKFDSLNNMLDEKIIPTINKMTESAKKWIKAHPDEIVDFFNDLKGLDIKGFAKGFASAFVTLAKGIQMMAKSLDGKSMKALGAFFGSAGFIGNFLTISGGLLKGSRHLVALVGTLGVGFGRLIGGLGAVSIGAKIAKIAEVFRDFFKVKAAAEAAEDAAKTAATKTLGLKAFFGNILKGLGGIAAAGVGALMIGGTVLGVVKMIKSITKDLGTISADMGKVDPNAMKSLAKWMGIIGGSIAALGVGGALAPGAAAAFEGGILAIGTIMSTIAGATWLTSKGIKGTMKNLADASKGIVDIGNNLNAAASIKLNKRGIANTLKTIGELVPSMKIQYQGAYKKKTLKEKDAKKMAGVFTHIKTLFEGLKGAVEAIRGMGKIPDMKAVGEKITPLIDGLGDIYSSMNEGFRANGVNAKQSKDYASSMKNAFNMFKSISSISKMIPDLTKSLTASVGTGKGKSPFDGFVSMMSGFSVGLGTIYESMKNNFMFKGNNAVGNSTGLYATSMKNVLNMFKSIQQIANIIPTLNDALSGIMGGEMGMYEFGKGLGGGGSVFTALTGQLKSMFVGLGEVVNSLNVNIPDTGGLVEKVTNLKDAIGKIGEAANALSSLGTGSLASADGAVFTAINSINSMITQLSTALNVSAIASIQAQVGMFKFAVDNLLQSIQDIGAKPVTVNITINGNVKYRDVLAKLRNARSRIESAVRSATRPIRRSISIHITPNVSVGKVSIPNFGGGGGGAFATGGYIYRAKGGGVPYPKKRGTDVVPAMLSHGEFVHRKAAVDTFGLDFMRKVNNLDIAGAMRALSARAGANSASARGTVINHNVTNNNNARVTQNINTNNPNFAFKRSNRYIGALV